MWGNVLIQDLVFQVSAEDFYLILPADEMICDFVTGPGNVRHLTWAISIGGYFEVCIFFRKRKKNILTFGEHLRDTSTPCALEQGETRSASGFEPLKIKKRWALL